MGKSIRRKVKIKENSDVRLVQKSLSNGQLMYWLEPRRHGSCKEINGAPAFAKRERKKKHVETFQSLELTVGKICMLVRVQVLLEE